jgi:hypothetical protein
VLQFIKTTALGRLLFLVPAIILLVVAVAGRQVLAEGKSWVLHERTLPVPSQVINNTATAVLVAPIVLQAAVGLGVSPHPLLMIVAVSASTAFLTPIGTTTNILVFSPGGYRFIDYVKVGLPLMLLFLAVSLVLVPVIWPL